MSDGKIFSLPARGVEMRQADCFAALPALPANSVDCVLTDPPYFLDGFDSDWDAGKLAKRMEHNGAIRSMPAGMKFCPRQGADFQRFFGKFSREIVRVLKPGGFFVSFSQGRLYHRMAVAAEEAGFEIRDMLAWKREGQPKAFTQSHFVRKMKIPETRKEEILRSLSGAEDAATQAANGADDASAKAARRDFRCELAQMGNRPHRYSSRIKRRLSRHRA